jgi:hypothetical protein
MRAKVTTPNAPNAPDDLQFRSLRLADVTQLGIQQLGIQLGILRVQQGSCLWWLVRGKLTAPNAPNTCSIRELLAVARAGQIHHTKCTRRSHTRRFGGEGGASLRTPNCRRALGLLLLDWSLVVLNHSPGSIQARWETLRVQQGSCLWWLVRDAETTPNAPNARTKKLFPRV